MNAYTEAGFQGEVSELNNRFSVVVDIKEMSQMNFSGEEMVLITVGFILSGIAGGIFESVGTDVWELIKRICLKIQRKTNSVTQKAIIKVEMILPKDNRHVTFTCFLEKGSTPDHVENFIYDIIRKIQAFEKETYYKSLDKERNSEIEYEFIDGKLKDK